MQFNISKYYVLIQFWCSFLRNKISVLNMEIIHILQREEKHDTIFYN